MEWIVPALLISFFGPTAFAAPLACSQGPGFLPDPRRRAGAADARNPIEHVIVIMQENHSFDQYFGRLNQPKFYGKELDGVDPSMTNPAKGGETVAVHHEGSLCVADPEHGWNAIHREWHGGAMDGFVRINGAKGMGYYDERDLPFYYDLADKFAVGDRYFCSALTQTFPNRFFLYSATAFGHIKNDRPAGSGEFAQETIFHRLSEFNVSWRYYKNGKGYLDLFEPLADANRDKLVGIDEFALDLANGTLPQVAFLDSSFEGGEDEHPKANVQVGQAFVAERLGELAGSPSWRHSVLFLTYDEGGGFFDHVAPPEACEPDGIAPRLGSRDLPGRFDRYGMRVPFVAVSPFVKHHFVSHRTYDHSSILKFIEEKFNLPALSARDANAEGLGDLFDFDHPDFATKPRVSLATVQDNCLP